MAIVLTFTLVSSPWAWHEGLQPGHGLGHACVLRTGWRARASLGGAVREDVVVPSEDDEREWFEGITLLQRAEAWWRRRHMLLAVRGRYGGASAAASNAE